MRKLHSDEIKNMELNILLKFDIFCKQYGLRYYLAGGTLLGAVRHKGFIPWDDDIDICMPRHDYEKAVRLFGIRENRYRMRSNRTEDFSAPFAKIVDLKTKIISKFSNSNIESNLWIDIFPVDGLPDDIENAKKIYNKCYFYRGMLKLCDFKSIEKERYIRSIIKYMIRPIANLYGKNRFIKRIEEIALSYPYSDAKYVGAITWGLYGIGERMLKVEYEKSVMLDFEGFKFPAFSCWDSYLKGLYGDYMQLPPVEKRKGHDMNAFII